MVSLDSKIAPIKTLQWDSPSVIAKVEVREQGKEQKVAYIHATEQAQGDYSKLFALREEFRRKGWATSSDNQHGKGVLRVTGIADEQQLIDVLNAADAVKGSMRTSYADVAGQDSKGAVDFVKSNSSRLSGAFYLLGDALMITRGFVADGKNIHQMGTGISFAAGDVAYLAFGGKDDKRQFTSLLGKLKKHLNAQGVEVPDGTALSSETLARPGGVLEKTYDFLHEHINPIKIFAEVGGGYLYQKGGMKASEYNPDKIIAGRVIMAGWLAALLVPEKKRDPEEWKEANPLQKAVMAIQNKPLMLAGTAGLIHNGFTIKGALKHRKQGVPHYQWDLAAVSAMLVANSLYSICSKSTGGNIKTDALVNDVYGIAAQILNRQPDAVREQAINATVDFLGQRPEIKDTKQQIAARLREEIRMQSENPWFKSIRHDGNALPSGEQKIADQFVQGQRTDAKVKDILAQVQAPQSHAEALDKGRGATSLPSH